MCDPFTSQCPLPFDPHHSIEMAKAASNELFDTSKSYYLKEIHPVAEDTVTKWEARARHLYGTGVNNVGLGVEAVNAKLDEVKFWEAVEPVTTFAKPHLENAQPYYQATKEYVWVVAGHVKTFPEKVANSELYPRAVKTLEDVADGAQVALNKGKGLWHEGSVYFVTVVLPDVSARLDEAKVHVSTVVLPKIQDFVIASSKATRSAASTAMDKSTVYFTDLSTGIQSRMDKSEIWNTIKSHPQYVAIFSSPATLAVADGYNKVAAAMSSGSRTAISVISDGWSVLEKPIEIKVDWEGLAEYGTEKAVLAKQYAESAFQSAQKHAEELIALAKSKLAA
jgi:hypothetical protein